MVNSSTSTTTTTLLAMARFAAAIARLCLGPLLPILSVSLGFDKSDSETTAAVGTATLLSSYSSGYILTQIGGGYLADQLLGFSPVIAGSLAISSVVTWYLAGTTATNTTIGAGIAATSGIATTTDTALQTWTQAYFALGLVAGPLFPAGSAAIAHTVPASQRAASAAIVDAAASAGTCVASLTPLLLVMLTSLLGSSSNNDAWRWIFQMISICLAMVAVAVYVLFPNNNNSSSSSTTPHTAKEPRSQSKDNKNIRYADDEEEEQNRPLIIKQAQNSTTTPNSHPTVATTPRRRTTSPSSPRVDQRIRHDDNHHKLPEHSLGDTVAHTTTQQHSSTTTTLGVLLQPTAILTYLCHSADNFTKYSINAYAATMLVSQHQASQATVGAILGVQEAVGVVAKVAVGILVTSAATKTSSSSSSNSSSSQKSTLLAFRGMASMVGFGLQSCCLWAAFSIPNSNNHDNGQWQVALCLVLSAVAAGAHSIGYRPIYVEAEPDHAGAISGVGNTIASLASVLGPITIGSSVQQQEQGDHSSSSWAMAAFWMWSINVLGALAGLAIVYLRSGGEGILSSNGYRWWLQYALYARKGRGQQQQE